MRAMIPSAQATPIGPDILDDGRELIEGGKDEVGRRAEDIYDGVTDWCDLNCDDLVEGVNKLICMYRTV